MIVQPLIDTSQVTFDNGTVCPLCSFLCFCDQGRSSGGEWFNFQCRQCGEYETVRSLGAAPIKPRHLRPFISAATRQHFEQGVRLQLTPTNLEEVARPHQESSVISRQMKILEYLARKCKRPGNFAVFEHQFDFPIADCENAIEVQTFLTRLVLKDLIYRLHNESAKEAYELSLEGWEAAEPKTQKGGTPGTCFVAMAFNKSLDSAYSEGILAAIESDCRYKALRTDRVEHNGEITDQIVAGIRECAFMVADLSLHRNGVYYEAGFARGLGRPVIYCCRKDQKNNVHFDIRGISHVIWDTPADLRAKLAHRIQATIMDQA